jgi:hypothetical protein
MPLPAFTADGDLPAGIHTAVLAEVLQRFGSASHQRALIAQRLAHIHHTATATGHVAHFVIFGSFVTAKQAPNDVDVFLIMEDTFDVAAQHGVTRLLFDHPAAQDHFGASIFWLRRCSALEGERAAIAHWQIKRNGLRRGIVEVIQEQP